MYNRLTYEDAFTVEGNINSGAIRDEVLAKLKEFYGSLDGVEYTISIAPDRSSLTRNPIRAYLVEFTAEKLIGEHY